MRLAAGNAWPTVRLPELIAKGGLAVCAAARISRRRYTFGPPARTSAEACDSYFLKLSRNSAATFLAFSS